jgi:hypothetical protein
MRPSLRSGSGSTRRSARPATERGLEGQPNWRERGPDGRLPAPPHDASGHTWHHPDELLFRITKHGVAKAANLKDYVSAMPAYDGVLSDAEIVAALSWIKAQWPAYIRVRHDELNRVHLPDAPGDPAGPSRQLPQVRHDARAGAAGLDEEDNPELADFSAASGGRCR